jgi:tRNA threonylcarbamoyl adenosine modification protein YeaZ
MRLLALDTATEACSVAVLTESGCWAVLREVGRGHADEILPMVDGMLAEAGITLGTVDAIVAGVGPGSFTGVRISVSVAQGLAFGAGVPVIAVNSLEALACQALWGVPVTGMAAAPGVAAGPGAEAAAQSVTAAPCGAAAGPGAEAAAQSVPAAPCGLAAGPGVAAAPGAAAAPGVAAATGVVDVLACLDARMGEVYWGCFSADAALGVIARTAPAVGPAADVWVPLNTAAGTADGTADGTAAGEAAARARFWGVGRGFAAYPELQSLPGVVFAAGALAALPDARDMVRLGALRYQAGWARDPADLAPLYVRDKVAFTEAERAAARGTPARG